MRLRVSTASTADPWLHTHRIHVAVASKAKCPHVGIQDMHTGHDFGQDSPIAEIGHGSLRLLCIEALVMMLSSITFFTW